MAKSQTKMIIEINEPILSKVIAVRGDANSRFIDVQLYNEGVPVDLNGHTVTMSVKTNPKSPMKNPVDEFISGTIPDPTNGRCMFPLTTSMLAEAGALDAQISVFSGEQEVLSTLTFIIYVEPSIRSDEQIEAENEFGVLVVLFSEIQNALDDLHAIATSFGEPSEESIAAGTDTFWKLLEKNIEDVSVAVAYDLPAKIGDPEDTADMPTMFGKIKLNNELLEANIGGEKIFDSSGPFSFDVPNYVNNLKVIAAGAGGGGDGDISTMGAGGGGGGDCVVMTINVTPNQKITGKVGAGGTGKIKDGAEPTDGEATVIDDVVTVQGGKKASNRTYGESGGVGGGKGGMGGSTSEKSEDGENGMFGVGGTALKTVSKDGGGGGGSYGKGGDGGASRNNGKNGVHGGGGGGGGDYSNGGNGGDGIVIFRWGIFEGSEVPLK